MSYEPTIEECLEEFNILGVHPAADLFPLAEGEEFTELEESIGKEGLEQDIVLTPDRRLLDGRNRLRACYSSGMPPRFHTLDDLYANDLVGYVVRLNIHRRNLTASQKAAITAEALKLYEDEAKERQVAAKVGNQNASKTNVAILPQVYEERPPIETQRPEREPPARDKAAKDFGASSRYVSDAKKLKDSDPDAFNQVKQGQVTIPTAMKETKKREQTKHAYITLTDWNERELSQVPNAEATTQFNKQSDNSEESMGNIEWAKWSWNPVTGCKHDCSYCYARDIAQRFYPQGFEPTIHPDRLTAPYHTNVPAKAEKDIAYRNVFANSMSDLYGRWVPQAWIDAVFQSMANNPQWNFLTLTKFPKRAAELTYPENVWIGTSVDLQARVKAAEKAFEQIECGVRWLSIEPMIEPLQFSKPELFDWVVIGGASASTQTPEWTPPSDWIIRVAAQFLEHGAKIYLKTNGRPREFPGVITPENADESFHYLGKKE